MKNYDYVLSQLSLTKEENFNLERINSLKDLNSNLVYNSVMHSLQILEEINPKNNKKRIYDTLLWMDIAKTGTKKERKIWKKRNYNLFTHNIGSSEIYKDYATDFNYITSKHMV